MTFSIIFSFLVIIKKNGVIYLKKYMNRHIYPTYMNFALRAQCCALRSAWHSGVNCLLLEEQYQNFYF